MNGSSDDNEIVATTASAEHMRKFVFTCSVEGGPEAVVERLEIKIPEVTKRNLCHYRISI